MFSLDHRFGHPNMPDAESFDCFLSHNSRNKPAVRALAEDLRARGISVWLDEDELRPGVPWQSLLESGISASRSVAVLVGADGLGPWENIEMRAALSLAVEDKRPVIPVLLADAPADPKLPLFLREFKWVDLRVRARSGDLTSLDRLIWGITGDRPDGASGDRPARTAGRSDDQGRMFFRDNVFGIIIFAVVTGLTGNAIYDLIKSKAVTGGSTVPPTITPVPPKENVQRPAVPLPSLPAPAAPINNEPRAPDYAVSKPVGTIPSPKRGIVPKPVVSPPPSVELTPLANPKPTLQSNQPRAKLPNPEPPGRDYGTIE